MKRQNLGTTASLVSLLLSATMQRYSFAFLHRPTSTVVPGFRPGICDGYYLQQQPNLLALFSTSSSSSSSSSAMNARNNGSRHRLFQEELNLIYDSKCNVCKLEIDFLRRRDLRLAAKRNKNDQIPRLKFTDLEGCNYNPKDPSNGGVSYETGMASIHAVTANGKVLTGVPVFTMAYQQVGLGWLFAMTKIPFMNKLLEIGYKLFAKYRTYITRGASVETLVQAYEEQQLLLEQKKKANEDDCEVCQSKV